MTLDVAQTSSIICDHCRGCRCISFTLALVPQLPLKIARICLCGGLSGTRLIPFLDRRVIALLPRVSLGACLIPCLFCCRPLLRLALELCSLCPGGIRALLRPVPLLCRRIGPAFRKCGRSQCVVQACLRRA